MAHEHDTAAKDDAHAKDDHAHAEGGHEHAPKNFGRTFALGIALQTAFIVAEVIVGLASHSLAVIADAGHNMSDALALGLAWGAITLGKRKASKGRTYGMKSASILAAVFNAMTLLFVNGAVAWEAVGRLRSPEPVAAVPMIIVSACGVVVNGFCAWLFAKGSEDDVNVRAAFLHLASDAAVAAGVAVTGAVIHYTGILVLDPIASLLVGAIVMVSTWSLLKRAMNLAMHAVPHNIDETLVHAFLLELPAVKGIHDLHVWAISTTENAMSAHLVVDAMPSGALACELDEKVRKKFKIHHVTIQIDPEGAACALEGDEIV